MGSEDDEAIRINFFLNHNFQTLCLLLLWKFVSNKAKEINIDVTFEVQTV